jgi:type II secretory pathway component GspD/PulD (secretin)
MSRITMGAASAGLAVVLCAGFYAAMARENHADRDAAPVAQSKGEAGSGPQRKRVVYFVKQGAPKDLGTALSKHFRGDLDVQVLPESPNDCLLISAAPAVFGEVVKLLEQLDRRPKLLAIELVVAETAPKKIEGGKQGPREKELDARALTGAVDEVLAKVEDLKKAGRIGYLRRIQLAAAEGQPASVSIGEMRPTVAGLNTSSTGFISRNITYRNTGTSVKVTARVIPDRQVVMDLNVEDTRGHVPEDGVPIGTDEKGQTVRAEEMLMAKLATRLSTPSGQAVAAQVVQKMSKADQGQTFVIAGARIVEP